MQVQHVDALLRRHYGIEPGALDDEGWCRLWGEYRYTEERGREVMQAAFRETVAEVIASIFKKDLS